MTTYDESAVSNTVIAHKKPITLQQGRALRDNPIAISEAATGAPVVVAGWHPYDMVKIGDGATGLIYDFAVSGAVASVETPVFDDGFEYAIRVVGISSTANAATLVIDLYKEADASYQNVYTSVADIGSSANLVDGWIEVRCPRLPKRVHAIEFFVSINITALAGIAPMYDATVQAISKARVSFSVGNIDAGRIYLYRRGMQG